MAFFVPLSVSTFVPTVYVRDSEVTTNRITFRWDEVPCEEQNDGYSWYRTSFSGRSLSRDAYREEILETNLSPCTTYSFSVAVINSRGVGPYSNVTEITTDTAGKKEAGRHARRQAGG